MDEGPWTEYQSGPWQDYGRQEVDPVSPPVPLADQAKRAAGLAGRSMIQGTLALPGMILGGAYGLYNEGANLAQKTGFPNLPESLGIAPQGFRFKDPNQQLTQDLTRLGLPEPKTGLEKGQDIALQILTGALTAPPIDKAFPKPLLDAGLPARATPKAYALKTSRDAGYVMPPSATGEGGSVSRALESFGGKAALKQQAIKQNQEVTNELAKKAASLGVEDDLTKTALAEARDRLAEPYREISKVSPTAGSALEKLKEVRFSAQTYWNHFNRSGDPTSLKTAKGLDAEAKTLESVIEREASKIGDPTLLERLRGARMAIAQNYSVQRALNESTGEVSAKTIGKIAGKKPLSGELATIGRFANTYPTYAGEAAKTGEAGVSAINPIGSAMFGLMGHTVAGWPGGILGASAPLLRGPVRSSLLSGPGAGLSPSLIAPAFVGEEAIRNQR